jgi:hypothetical protein
MNPRLEQVSKRGMYSSVLRDTVESRQGLCTDSNPKMTFTTWVRARMAMMLFALVNHFEPKGCKRFGKHAGYLLSNRAK